METKEASSQEPAALRRVLVIDDEPGIRDLLEQELQHHGYAVETAADGVEALERLAKSSFQLAICDINMPRLSGMETLAEIRKRDPNIEVIMMTGYATVETAVYAMKQGAYDYIQKPFNLDEVLALAEKSFEKSGMRSVIQELRIAKKKLEETQAQLLQSEKLAALGLLAAGVAHELNNPLSGVMGFTQLLLADSKIDAQQRSDLETILEQCNRCKTIILNLLKFSRRKEPVKEPIDLVPLIRLTLDLVQYEFKTTGVAITKEIPSTLPPVMGDSDQLQQVFLNLMTNAWHAMEGRHGGTFRIQVTTDAQRVHLRFQDTGSGIAPDVLGKIFDPFFTTKPPGKGTGLGLSICYGIIQDHGGTIRVESKVNEGSTFIVELPLYPLPE